MTPLLTIYLILIVILLALVAFFAGTETAVTSANRLSINEKVEQNDKRAKIVADYKTNFDHFLSLVLTGTNLVNVALVTIAGLVIENYLLKPYFQSIPQSWWETISALIITPIILIYGEILPKSLARQNPEPFSLKAAKALVISDKILTPITNAITFLSKVAQKVMGLGGNDQQTPDQKSITKEDLQAIAEIAAEQGMVPQKAGDMLQIVLELDEKPVSNAMTPLVDIVSIPENATAYEVEKLTQATGFSRFPVFKDRVDNIIGVIGLRQLVTAFSNDDVETFRRRPIKNLVDKSVLFVPETKPINHLIAELRRHYIPMAVVIDEYGGMIGLATIEDLAQQIVGSIQDFGEQDQHPCKPTDDEMICDGRTPIRVVEDAFDVEIENEGFETIAGLVLKIAGTIPKINATFHYQDFRITVLDKQNHRITKVKIKRIPQL